MEPVADGLAACPSALGEARGDPDDALVQAARADALQFGPLYERYVEQVYRYIASRVSLKPDVDDLVASVFLHALRGLQQYRGRGSFRVWLFAIAHNLVVDYHRKRQRAPALRSVEECTELVSGELDPGMHLLQQERLNAVAAAFRRLPRDQQSVLALKFAAGLTNREIGQVVGKSEGAVKMLVSRGVHTIRRACQDEGYGAGGMQR